jgi:methionyl-tRNA synthetase
MPQKFYITTAIPYASGEPHIGHFLEFIQADVLARYHRQLGQEVFFLTGTDEHGIKIAENARKANKAPKEFVDAIAKKFQEIADALRISYSHFIRTTNQEKHWPNVRKLWELLEQSGDIYKGHYRGKYCIGCEKYLVASDLENGLCPFHQTPPQELDEDNYFFRLSRYQEQLKKLIQDNQLLIVPDFRRQEVLAFIEQGLEDISFSRPREKLQWGIPVPNDDSQMIYVWADALTNYLSGVDFVETGLSFQRFWPPDIQIVGKDIWRFHALYWPAMLLSAHLPLPKTLFVHGFVTVGGQKISKSLGNGVSPIEIMQKFSVDADAVRYFFLREISPVEDGDYSDEKFLARYNSDLANGIGNLLARTNQLGVLAGGNFVLNANVFQETIDKARSDFDKAIEQFRFNDALALVGQLVKTGDGYINGHKPWELLKQPATDNSQPTTPNNKQEEFGQIISSLVLLLANLADLLAPFMPSTSEKILLALGLAGKPVESWKGKIICFQALSPLFPRK